MTTRADILDLARRAVTVDRAATHGDLRQTFPLIARLWSQYLGFEVGGADVALMLALMKVARARENPAHTDNWVDIAGYAACGGELALPEPLTSTDKEEAMRPLKEPPPPNAYTPIFETAVSIDPQAEAAPEPRTGALVGYKGMSDMVLVPHPNGGWTVLMNTGSGCVAPSLGAYSSAGEMLVALTDLLCPVDVSR